MALSAGLPKLNEGAEVAPATALEAGAPKLKVEATGGAALAGVTEPNKLVLVGA